MQLYVSAPDGPVRTPRRELRAFEKVTVEPGESVRVEFELTRRAYTHWDVDTSSWMLAGGTYRIEVGSSASAIKLTTSVTLAGPPISKLTLDSRVSEFLAHPVTGTAPRESGR